MKSAGSRCKLLPHELLTEVAFSGAGKTDPSVFFRWSGKLLGLRVGRQCRGQRCDGVNAHGSRRAASLWWSFVGLCTARYDMTW